MRGNEFLGIEISKLLINEIWWSPERSEHIRSRSKRYEPKEFDVEPEWATEAALDPKRIVGLAGGRSGSLEVIGYSQGATQLLKVWLYPDDVPRGRWHGVSACKANSTDRRNYQEVQDNGK